MDRLKQKILYFSAIFTVLGVVLLVFSQNASAELITNTTGSAAFDNPTVKDLKIRENNNNNTSSPGGNGKGISAAEVLNGVKDIKGQQVSTGSSAPDPTDNIISKIFIWSGILCVAIIIFSGILFITAAGKPNTLSRAKSALLYAIVGLIIIIMAYSIVKFILNAA